MTQEKHLRLKEQFDEAGYVVIPSLFSDSEIDEFRAKIQSLSGKQDTDFDFQKAMRGGWSQPDGVTQNKDFWPLIFHPKLLQHIRSILGENLRYTQHSDLHVHHGTIGWHRDSKDRIFGKGQDWDENLGVYEVARVAIYLQSFKESRFKLGVIPGSHRFESLITKTEIRCWNSLFRWKDGGFIAPVLSVKPVWIPIDSGDCVIFNQRLYHSGSRTYGPKYSIYLSYGSDNEHSRNHMRYYRHQRKDLSQHYQKPSPQLEEWLRRENLYMEI